MRTSVTVLCIAMFFGVGLSATLVGTARFCMRRLTTTAGVRALGRGHSHANDYQSSTVSHTVLCSAAKWCVPHSSVSLWKLDEESAEVDGLYSLCVPDARMKQPQLLHPCLRSCWMLNTRRSASAQARRYKLHCCLHCSTTSTTTYLAAATSIDRIMHRTVQLHPDPLAL